MSEFNRLINDDVFNVLPKLKDTSFNTVFADPPYGLSSNWFIDKDGSFQIKNNTKDFMGIWKTLTGKNLDDMFFHFNRVLKHGGYCILFGLDNQIAPFQYYAVKNGFEVCQSLYWYYCNNMPKATDVSLALDKRSGKDKEREVVGKYKLPNGQDWNLKQAEDDSVQGSGGTFTSSNRRTLDITKGVTELAQKYDGYKYGRKPLKQVVETIMVYRKTSKHKTVLDDIIASEHDDTISPSIINVKDNKVEYTSEKDKESARFGQQADLRGNNLGTNRPSEGHILATNVLSSEDGRYPPNVYLTGTEEVIDNQSGIKKSCSGNGDASVGEITDNANTPLRRGKLIPRNDSGGASRILPSCKYEEEDDIDLFLYCPKTSSNEKNAGLDTFESKEGFRTSGKGIGNKLLKCPEHGEPIPSGKNTYKCGCSHAYLDIEYEPQAVKNPHPTTKPQSLLISLMKLFKLPEECNQKVLVPFSGVLSEVISITKAGIKPENITAIEISKEYCDIGKARYKYWTDKWQEEEKK